MLWVRYTLSMEKIVFEEMANDRKPNTITELLTAIADMVVVTGSWAEGTQTESSDIDLYVKPLPSRHILRKYGHETYVPVLMKKLHDWGYEIRSCYPLTFAVDAFGIMLDFSALFEIGKPKDCQLFGAKMKMAKSTYKE